MSERPWARYADQRPLKVGMYQWRLPSSAVPGLVVRVVAKYRKRGAGLQNVLSPDFDHWDGYRVHVPAGLEWRARIDGDANVEPEGVEVDACPFCERVPVWRAYCRSVIGGTVVSPAPQTLNTWQLACCAWGVTPSFRDPRELATVRSRAFGRMRGEVSP